MKDVYPATSSVNKICKKMLLGLLLTAALQQEATAQTYCTPTAMTSTFGYINSFSTTLGSTNINNTNSGFSTNGYGNFSATQIVTAINTNSFNFSGAFNSSTFGVKIWADWNHNGLFTDPGEQVYVTTGYVSSFSGSITIPAAALSGNTRMRVGADWLSGTGPTNACTGSSTYGEFEDYTINVVPLAPPNNAGVGSLITPDNTPFCSNSSKEVSVSVINLGSNALNTANISWSVNNVMQPGLTLATPLPNYKDSVTVVLGNVFFSTTDPVQIKAWTSMPNGVVDTKFADDTLKTSAAAVLQGVSVHISPRDTTICQGSTITLNADTFAFNPIYIWSTGSLNQTIPVNQPGQYSVKVQNTLGCFDMDTVMIAVHPNPLLNSIAIVDNGSNNFTFNAIGAQNVNSWTWDFGDMSATASGTGLPAQQIHQYTTAGEFTVTLTLTNDCNEIMRTRLVKIDATGIDNLSELQKELKLYPNPARSQVMVSSYNGSLKISNVEVYNLMGQRIYSAVVKGNKHQIDISAMSAGIYNVIIATDKGKVTKKLEVIQ